MSILTVDLASKFSAYALTTKRGQVAAQGDSLGKSAQQFVRELRSVTDEFEPTIILLEDLPYGIKNQKMTKPATRLQGAVILELIPYTTLWINPDTWQKEYPGVGRGGGEEWQRIEAAANYARERGYEPPDLVGEYLATVPEGKRPLKKHTNPLEKVMTDYVDAFLMSDYAWNHDIQLMSVRDYRTSMTGVQVGSL